MILFKFTSIVFISYLSPFPPPLLPLIISITVGCELSVPTRVFVPRVAETGHLSRQEVTWTQTRLLLQHRGRERKTKRGAKASLIVMIGCCTWERKAVGGIIGVQGEGETPKEVTGRGVGGAGSPWITEMEKLDGKRHACLVIHVFQTFALFLVWVFSI